MTSGGSDSPSLPRHVAIIMDGNGRWAARHGVSREEGHEAGAKSVRATVEICRELGVLEPLQLAAHLRRARLAAETVRGVPAEFFRHRDEPVERLPGVEQVFDLANLIRRPADGHVHESPVRHSLPQCRVSRATLSDKTLPLAKTGNIRGG